MAVAETSSAPSGIMGQFSGLAQLQGLQSSQKFGLMLATAAVIALLVGSWMWSQTPDYRVLYANVSDRDGGASRHDAN